jgi:hypothetical protein
VKVGQQDPLLENTLLLGSEGAKYVPVWPSRSKVAELYECHGTKLICKLMNLKLIKEMEREDSLGIFGLRIGFVEITSVYAFIRWLIL